MQSNEALAQWVQKELSNLLEFDIGDDYAKNIVRIETESELREFVGSLLDLSVSANKSFLNELLVKLNKLPAGVTVYKKPDLDEDVKSKRQPKAKTPANEEVKPGPSGNKKAGTFSLNPSTAGQSKPANRAMCECQATEHKLVANCLRCGRIVCEKEGSGPCYFCSNLVCTAEELEKIKRGSIKGEKLKAELLSRAWPGGVDLVTQSLQASLNIGSTDEQKLKRAIEHKNKLIDFDRSSAKRTQVIDDESDYFSTNSKWLSQKQRALLQQKENELREKRFGSRLNKTAFTIDFAGRKVVDEGSIDFKKFEEEAERITSDKSDEPSCEISAVINPETRIKKLQFIEENKLKKPAARVAKQPTAGEKKLRIQDSDLQELKDDGMCLSMHQPWASLLVAGIKVHEGRSWYTPYRGRLWIHAASKEPSQDDIKELETFYKCRYINEGPITFPDNYPTSCLLGYVDLTDCLDATTYKERYPDGESESEYVFICENPNELMVKLPMPGQHKIFKLEHSIHHSVKKIPTF